MTPNSELTLLHALTRGLVASEHQPGYRATGQYVDHSRVIELEFGDIDVGPMIGKGGAMKAALQSLLAAPFGADGCQLRFHTNRGERKPRTEEPVTAKPVEDVLEALKQHLPPGSMTYRVETTDTAAVAIVEATDRFTDALRGPLNRVCRGIGRTRGFIVALSIEQIEVDA